MSPSEDLLASSPQPEGSPDIMEASSEAFDTEMTCPLTLDEKEEKEFQVSPSPSIANEDMAFNGRDRGSTNGFINNQNSGVGHGHPSGGQNGGFSAVRPDIWRTTSSSASMGSTGQLSQFNSPPLGAHVNANGYFHGSASYDPATPGLMNNRYRSNSSIMPAMPVMPPVTESVPLSIVNPGPVWPAEHQLSVAHAYGIRNEDGSYTRLIRADDLDRFLGYNIAPHQSSEGLIILPPTRVPSPNSRRGNEQHVPRNVVNQLPPVLSRRPSVPFGLDRTQMQIDNIVASNNARSPPRREKIYCDKWIHDGTCAFTQVGCKYKHTMPTDKVTQVSLGLNHGFPGWFKRANRDVIDGAPGLPTLPSPTASTASENAHPVARSRMDNNWRGDVSRSGPGIGNIAKGRTSSSQNGVPLGRSSYGPIGPPSRPNTSRASSYTKDHNSFGSLKREDSDDIIEDAEEEEDQVTFRGRGNSPR